MGPDVRAALAAALGAQVRSATPLAGGDINEAYRVELSDGRRLFLKTHPSPPRGMYATEAAGLRWLAEPAGGGASTSERLAVPEVLAVSDGDDGPSFLALELMEPGRPLGDFDERLGRGLAELHRRGAPSFGFSEDNFIGVLPQSNRPWETWVDFYRHERLAAQLALPRARSLLPSGLRQRFERLLADLERWAGPPEPPARLHGDLWGGNLHRTASGHPALIDPAVYGGHREMDLAMMRLFGGFSARVFAAYEEAFPLSPGARERVALWQLYPLLVHVNLFGGGYVSQVADRLSAYC